MKTVLLTGCTSGIGKALSKEFASDNHNLILVARTIQGIVQKVWHLHLSNSM